MADGEGVLVDEGERSGREVLEDANAKAKEDSFLDPGIDTPAGWSGRVGGRGAEFAAFKGIAQGKEGFHGGGIVDRRSAGGEVALDCLLKMIRIHSL